MIKNHSIRQSMAVLTLVPLCLLALLLEVFLLHGRYADLDQTLLDRGCLIARQLASSSEYGVFANNRDFLNNLARNGLKEADVSGVIILDADNQVLVETGEFSTALLPELTHAVEVKNTGLATTQLTRTQLKFKPSSLDEQMPLRNEADKILIYQPIVASQINLDENALDAKVKHTGAVIIEVSKTRVQHHKQQILLISLGVTLACLGLTFYLVLLASRRITYPIRQLSLAVQRVAQGELSSLLATPSNIVELSTLNHGMSNMLIMLAKDRSAMQDKIDAATRALRKKKEQAEEATQQKSVFLAVASHDLRQPLHALGLYAAELRRKLSGSSEQPLVERIEQSVDALATLLNALLDISKLDAGAVVPQWQSCNLTQIMSRVESDYRMQAQMKKIRFVVRPCVGWVRSDAILLERILMNLVSNALRYTPENGCVMIACRKRGNQLRIEVRDNGVGISSADQVRIFREFSQVAKTQLDNTKGLGLGLAIVDRLAQLLGHGIEVRSMLQRGSLFAVQASLSTPIELSANAVSYPVIQAISVIDHLPLSNKNILVVDDDELVLTSTAAILESWGGTVFTANSLNSVIELLALGGHWDLIVSDYQLSATETGLDVIAAVRVKLGNAPQGILISGNTGPELLQLASSTGLHLLHKPVKPAKLRSLSLFLLKERNDS
ncbi:MAG: hypothetical protein RL358_1279 [Pseudomonadota bacterium]